MLTFFFLSRIYPNGLIFVGGGRIYGGIIIGMLIGFHIGGRIFDEGSGLYTGAYQRDFTVYKLPII